MHVAKEFIEPLIHKAEDYSRTSLKVIRLKATEKFAIASATLMTNLLLIMLVLFWLVSLNIACALWLGEWLGKNYYGFLLVAGIYLFVAIVIFLLKPTLKRQIADSVLENMLN